MMMITRKQNVFFFLKLTQTECSDEPERSHTYIEDTMINFLSFQLKTNW